MSTAWGKTGRVTLDSVGYEFLRRVLVDGEKVGVIASPSGDPSLAWDCEIPGLNGPGWAGWWDGVAPSRDAAIMWVLRRAAPDVWREERGPVWRVKPMWHVGAFDGLPNTIDRPEAPATGWLAEGPERGDEWAIRDDWRTAVVLAERYARDARARMGAAS